MKKSMLPRKCLNCKEWEKDCDPLVRPKCELKTMIIEQAIEPHKVQGLANTLAVLRLNLEYINEHNFTFTRAQ